MRKVVLESPYAGDVERNILYARRCMKDCLERNEAPFASHLLYTQEGILDDSNPIERLKGMRSGFEWGQRADYCVVYTDYGVSKGMMEGIEEYSRTGKYIEFRSIGKNEGEGH